MLTAPLNDADKKYFLVHMTLKDKEDGELFVIENEFLSKTWITAWSHVMTLPAKFNADLVSHRIREVDKQTGVLLDQPKNMPLALPAPRPVVHPKIVPPAKEALPEWATRVTVDFPNPFSLKEQVLLP